MSEDKKNVIERTAWPANPIETYASIESGEWGYLVIFSDGTFDFEKSRPSDGEIIARWGFQFNGVAD